MSRTLSLNLCSRGQYQKESTEKNVSSSVVISLFPLFSLQLNISFPATGCQKLIEVDDERKLRTFYEKRMATEVAADPLGDEWKVRLLFFLTCTHTLISFYTPLSVFLLKLVVLPELSLL